MHWGSLAKRQINHMQYRARPSSFAHRSCPANDRFLPRADSPVADPTILGKWTLCSYRTHPHSGLVFFKQQHVARAYPERPADSNGHGNPAFRCNLCMFLQAPGLPIPYVSGVFLRASAVRFWFVQSDQCHPRESVVRFQPYAAAFAGSFAGINVLS